MNSNRGSVLAEVFVLVLIALVLGAAVHMFRSSGEKIEWVKDYPDATTPPPVPKEAPAHVQNVSELKTDPIKSPIISEKQPKSTEGASSKPPPPPPPPPLPAKEVIREITVEEAILEHKNNTPFLDARRTKEFHKGHIPGAISMSVWEPNLDARISELLTRIDPGMTVVIYCTGGECTDSHNLATSLEGAGYKEIRIMKGGVPDWVKQGGPAAERTAGADGDSKEEGE